MSRWTRTFLNVDVTEDDSLQAATAADDSDRMRKVFESKAAGVSQEEAEQGVMIVIFRTRRGWPNSRRT